MTEYHLVWLANHPHRTAEWLKDRLRDGFDIHHLDGNHSNNAPSNLVLIENQDHQDLHGYNRKMCRIHHTDISKAKRARRIKKPSGYDPVYEHNIGPFGKWFRQGRVSNSHRAERYVSRKQSLAARMFMKPAMRSIYLGGKYCYQPIVATGTQAPA